MTTPDLIHRLKFTAECQDNGDTIKAYYAVASLIEDLEKEQPSEADELKSAIQQLLKTFDEQAARLKEATGGSIRFQMVEEAVNELKFHFKP